MVLVLLSISRVSKAGKEGRKNEITGGKQKAAEKQLHLPSDRHYNQMAAALPRQHRGW